MLTQDRKRTQERAPGPADFDRPGVPPTPWEPGRAAAEHPAVDDDPWFPARPTGEFDLGLEAQATLRLLLVRRRTIGVLTGLAVAVGAALTFLMPPTYESRVLLLPAASEDGLAAMGLGQAAGLASTLGFNLGTPSMTMAYPDMLKSRQIRERMLAREFQTAGGGRSTLEVLLRPSGRSADEKRAQALDLLDRKVRVGIDKETGVLQLVTSAGDAQLAQQLAAAYVDELGRIEDELQASAARANREFVEKRLADTQATLVSTEESFKSFQEGNRHLGSDAELQLRAARLARDVRVQEEIYLTLVRQHELAKIEENRQTPNVQVIDPPSRPLARSSPILLKNLVLSACLGFIGASLLVVGLDWWSTVRLRLGAWADVRSRVRA